VLEGAGGCLHPRCSLNGPRCRTRLLSVAVSLSAGRHVTRAFVWPIIALATLNTVAALRLFTII
jgi:hypothetical protein